MQIINGHVVLNLFALIAVVLMPVCLVLGCTVRELSRATSKNDGSGYATFALLSGVRLLALSAALVGLMAALCMPFG